MKDEKGVSEWKNVKGGEVNREIEWEEKKR